MGKWDPLTIELNKYNKINIMVQKVIALECITQILNKKLMKFWSLFKGNLY
jgi:hypothetical protein